MVNTFASSFIYSKKALLKGFVHVLRRKKPDLTKKSFIRFCEALDEKEFFFKLKFTQRYEADNSSQENRLKNKKMKKKYDEDPRCFWNDREARDTFPSFLVSVAIFVFFILSSSASCEQAFSRMG